MPPAVIDVRKSADIRDVIHRAVQALAEGELVAFPTETVYGLAASALNEQGVARLIAAKTRQAGHPFSLAIRSADEAMDYVPKLGILGRRLARRCWPGPVTLVLDDNHPESLLHRLPDSVFPAVCPSGTIGLRVPGHQLILDVLDLLAGPLVLSSANRSGEPDAVAAKDIVQSLGDEVALVLDDGHSQFGQPSSVVRVRDGEMTILRAGVVSEATLNRLASFMIVLVCTGNTCRSPMAEVLCRQRLAEKLGCNVDELEDRGVVVMSAGIAAMAGCGASPEAVEIMAQRNLDLSKHTAQPLTPRLMQQADIVYTMTHGHRAGVINQWPEAAAFTHLLCPQGNDVSDPIGGTTEMYARCAEQIDAALESRLAELDLDSLVRKDS